jgi:hypothetical protein
LNLSSLAGNTVKVPENWLNNGKDDNKTPRLFPVGVLGLNFQC